MSTLYLVALGGVCLVLMLLLWESLRAVSRAPVWETPRLSTMPLASPAMAAPRHDASAPVLQWTAGPAVTAVWAPAIPSPRTIAAPEEAGALAI